ARLYAEAQQLRERVVHAREMERQNLGRKLHDEVCSALSSHSLWLGMARERLKSDPAWAEAALERIETELRETYQAVRCLGHDLYLPALVDLGLIEALRQHIATLAQGETGIRMSFHCPEHLPSLSTADVVIYRIALLALDNVVQHSRAISCQVNLAMDRQSLHLEVSDNGCGLQDNYRPGIGLLSMRER